MVGCDIVQVLTFTWYFFKYINNHTKGFIGRVSNLITIIVRVKMKINKIIKNERKSFNYSNNNMLYLKLELIKQIQIIQRKKYKHVR